MWIEIEPWTGEAHILMRHAPRRGMWIEMIPRESFGSLPPSHAPRRGMWIEIDYGLNLPAEYTVMPRVGACGLKFCCYSIL